MKAKTTIYVLTILLVATFIFAQLQANNAFEPVLSIHENADSTYYARAGDTLSVSIPASNSSWKLVVVTGKTGSCRVAKISIPDKIEAKNVERLNIKIAAPLRAGDYHDNVVLRTNTREAFQAVSLHYVVRDSLSRL